MLVAGPARTAQLLSLPAGAAARSLEGVVRRIAGQPRDVVAQQLRERNAAHTRRVLGGLKGGAQKAGQLLSTVDALFPADVDVGGGKGDGSDAASWTDALTSLQDAAPGLPFTEVEPVFAAELGEHWTTLLALDTVPAAAASIGQVHRATWADGRQVAVKVQYPGVREALTTDLRTLSAVTRVTALVSRGLSLPPLLAEMRDRLVEELDYLREARVQEAFATAYAGDPDIVVPVVVFASPRVLVTEWLEGRPLADVARTGSPAERDRAAALYQAFLVSGPERAGWLHTDPHPGNFRITADGRLGVLDFGSALPMPGGLPSTFGRLIAALLTDDGEVVLRRLREERFLRPEARVEVEKLMDYMSPFTVPARHDYFRFGRAWLRQEFARVNDPRAPEFAVALKLDLPAEHLFTHRVWLGMVGVLCQLEATVPVRAVLERWLPGFDGRAGGQ